MPSKLITDREKSANAVAHAGTTNAAAISEAFTARYGDLLQKGEKMPDLGLAVQLVMRRLRATTTALTAADQAHAAELDDDTAPREARDDGAQALRSELITIRGVVGGGYGPKAERAAGFVGEIPADPVVLVRYGAEIASRLKKLALPKPLVEGVAINPAQLAARVEKLVTALDGHIQDVAREANEAKVTLSAKNDAIKSYDEQFAMAARLVESALLLAGKPDLAEKVKPSARRPGVTQSGDEASADPAAATPEPAPATMDAAAAGGEAAKKGK